MRLQIVAERHSQTNERADRCPEGLVKCRAEGGGKLSRHCGKQKNELKIKVNTMTIYIY